VPEVCGEGLKETVQGNVVPFSAQWQGAISVVFTSLRPVYFWLVCFSSHIHDRFRHRLGGELDLTKVFFFFKAV
jgi:hypothetical protein